MAVIRWDIKNVKLNLKAQKVYRNCTVNEAQAGYLPILNGKNGTEAEGWGGESHMIFEKMTFRVGKIPNNLRTAVSVICPSKQQ